MKTNTFVRCADFPCEGVNHDAYLVSDLDASWQNADVKR